MLRFLQHRIGVVLFAGLWASSFSICVLGQAEQIVTDAQGRKIILKANKTWEYVAEKPPPEKKNLPTADKNIKGDDIAQIGRILVQSKEKFQKSEFETEAEYLKRIRILVAETTNPATGKRLDETVAVFTDVTSYDAESRKFSLSPRFVSFSMIRSRGSGNAIKFVEWHGSSLGWYDYRNLPTLTFSFDPEQAREIKAELALAVYGVPVEYETYSGLELVPLKFVAFNTRTGEIYASLDNPNPFRTGK